MSEQEFHPDGSTKIKKECLTGFIYFFFLTEHINSSVDDAQLGRNHLRTLWGVLRWILWAVRRLGDGEVPGVSRGTMSRDLVC